jgi:uncharacterized protein YjbI with pentapeptide repeats
MPRHHADVSETACRRPHHAASPQVTAEQPATEAPTDCDEDVHDIWLQHARVLELDLDRPEITDVRLEDCDVSGIVASGAMIRRMTLTRTRLRGVTFAKGQFDDGVVRDCVTSELSFRFSKLRQVVFRACDLSGVDFYNTTFEHVTIDNCDLQRAGFDAAIVKCLAITNCNLAGVRGVSGLKGAQVDASDLPGLAQTLATEAGILIRDA